MKIKIVKIKRLFHGFASARSYIIEDAIKNYKAIRFVLPDGRTMTLHPDKLRKYFKNDLRIKSKQIVGQVYDLYDYDWKDDKIEVQDKLI